MVTVEVRVLDGEHRGAQRFRDPVERNDDAVLGTDELADRLAVHVQDLAALEQVGQRDLLGDIERRGMSQLGDLGAELGADQSERDGADERDQREAEEQ